METLQNEIADLKLRNEIADLKQQLQGVENVLRQNALLENAVEKLCKELDDATKGVLKRGYLYKWRDREISFASKWGLRYFVLQGASLSYFAHENDNRPRRTIDLSRCSVRNEGVKKYGHFHVFGIYLDDNTLLYRLSTETATDAEMWIDSLKQSCSVGRELLDKESSMVDNTPGSPLSLARTNSASLILRRSLSISGNVNDMPISPSDIPGSPLRNFGFPRANSLPMTNTTGGGLPLDSLPAADPAHVKAQPTPSAHQTRSQVPPKTIVMHTFPGSKPIHVSARSSPLSSDNVQGEQNYRGFFNLGLIIMLLAHVRLILDNRSSLASMSRTPIAVDFVESWLSWLTVGVLRHAALALLSWVGIVLIHFTFEVVSFRGYLGHHEKLTFPINLFLGMCNLILPIVWVWNTESPAGLAMLYLGASLVLWVKMWSYSHCNMDLRKTWRLYHLNSAQAKKIDKANAGIGTSGGDVMPESKAMRKRHKKKLAQKVEVAADEQSDRLPVTPAEIVGGDNLACLEVKDLLPPFVQYPNNLTIPNLLYFIAVPTLCYQMNYPRTPSIRWKHVITYLARMAFIGIVVLYAVSQFISPRLADSAHYIDELNIGGVAELLLKLSIPNTYVWLLGFYWFFHLYLNLLAELLCFGDRQFYKDWWNCRTIDAYWRTWNLPVHHWMLRHMYYPMIRRGVPKTAATLVHAFLGMLSQAPLIYVTKVLDGYLQNSYISNALFWIVFCIVGQPMGVILYYHDFNAVRAVM